jgi:hypothetical protein
VVVRLRAILQAKRGARATEDLAAAAESEPGRPLWAYAQLGATHLNNFAMSWAGQKADGSLVISLWRVRQPPSFVRGDDGRWVPTKAARLSTETTGGAVRRSGVRATFYDALENVVNTKRAVVEAIVSSPEDQAATTWKRVDSRPWLDTDGTPVRLRVANVDRGADRYDCRAGGGQDSKMLRAPPFYPAPPGVAGRVGLPIHRTVNPRTAQRHFRFGQEWPRVLLQSRATLKPRGGFVALTRYYRPAGLPREQQPWLASCVARIGILKFIPADGKFWQS